MDASIVLTRAILFLPHSLLQWQREVSTLPNRELWQQKKLYVQPCIFVPDRELDFFTGSPVNLNILVNMQEPFSKSHHRITFNYDEDTVSLVAEQTLATLEVSLSGNSDSSAGMHP